MCLLKARTVTWLTLLHQKNSASEKRSKQTGLTCAAEKEALKAQSARDRPATSEARGARERLLRACLLETRANNLVYPGVSQLRQLNLGQREARTANSRRLAVPAPHPLGLSAWASRLQQHIWPNRATAPKNCPNSPDPSTPSLSPSSLADQLQDASRASGCPSRSCQPTK